MRPGITRQVADSRRFETIETTLLEVITALVEIGFCDDQIVEAIQKAEERGELHLRGQFRDEDVTREEVA